MIDRTQQPVWKIWQWLWWGRCGRRGDKSMTNMMMMNQQSTAWEMRTSRWRSPDSRDGYQQQRRLTTTVTAIKDGYCWRLSKKNYQQQLLTTRKEGDCMRTTTALLGWQGHDDGYQRGLLTTAINGGYQWWREDIKVVITRWSTMQGCRWPDDDDGAGTGYT